MKTVVTVQCQGDKVKKDLVQYFDQPRAEQLWLKITSGRIYILQIIKYRPLFMLLLY